MVVPTAGGFALGNKSIRPKEGDTVYFEVFGLNKPGLFGNHYIVCQDGDALEGEALEEVTIVGVQTWGVVSVHDDNRPTI